MKRNSSLAILTVLEDLCAGDVAMEASDKFTEVIKAVRERGGSGELTIKLSMKSTKEGAQVEMKGAVTSKEPKRDLGKSIFYTTDHGQVTRQDPNQMGLPGMVEDDPRAL